MSTQEKREAAEHVKALRRAAILNAVFAVLATVAIYRDPAPAIYVADCLRGLGWIVTLC